MYGLEDGSRQYRVEQGSTVVVDYRETEPGQTLEFDRASGVQRHGHDGKASRWSPAKVVAEVVSLPTKKTVIQHFRRRKNYRRLKGHTQPYVQVKIKDIVKG